MKAQKGRRKRLLVKTPRPCSELSSTDRNTLQSFLIARACPRLDCVLRHLVQRWSVQTRNWEPVETVTLNPKRTKPESRG